MSELSGFAEIAPYLTHPLVLVGFGLLLFFALLRAVLKSRVMPEVSQSTGGRALLSLLRYGFVVALVVIVLGFLFAFYQTERTTVDADEIIRDFEAATKADAASQSTIDAIARLEELQDGNAFRAAVLALVRQSKDPNAPREIDRALQLLRQGKTGAAETAFAQLLDRRLQERASASAEAAEAARNLGAIAYLADTVEAIEAYKTATELDPDDTWSWIFLGRLYHRAGNLAAAEQVFERARELAEHIGDEREIGIAYEELETIRQAKGDLRRALEAYDQSHAIFSKLVDRDPDNFESQRHLSVSYDLFGKVLFAQGDRAGALQAYEQGRAIADQLANKDPSNTQWQHDLGIFNERLGDVLVAQGRLNKALRLYEGKHRIVRALAARDPDNGDWQRDLSVSFIKIGDAHSARGDLDGALQAYRDSLASREKLAAQDPNNAEWQRDLSVSFEKIGDVQRARGDLAAALKAYRDRHAFAEKLAAQDPSNAQWQRDVWVSMWRLAKMEGGGVSWAEVLDRMEAMKARGVLLPTDEPFLEQARAQAAQ